MKGYKVFNGDWTCRDFKYEVGKTEVKSIPNFDAKIFKEITGIEVGEDE